ncbi:MAG: prolipoprotein diacylglyceryl transferase [Clostridiales bacterium]|nr:prolipoprotein diacylglyceryl transferase [Clostridiales bacterium]
MFSRKTRPQGAVSALYIVIYSVMRFIFEFYRGDLVRGVICCLKPCVGAAISRPFC